MTHDPLDVARFWSHVKVTLGIRGCWKWRGAKDGGYGVFKLLGRTVAAHRVAYAFVHGDIPDGLVVRHKCHTPPCCNPTHLETGTHADNVRDRVLRDRSRRRKLARQTTRQLPAVSEPQNIVSRAQ